MKAIRGATTVAQDTPEQIREGVKELLNGIVQANGLNTDRIICIMFSSTADLKSYYPAKAAREAGFSTCALYSSRKSTVRLKTVYA
ncbi:MAG: chorismate mutase [Clostridia bacterium]|nr:chorismate mutase [Clostridia bacterium]